MTSSPRLDSELRRFTIDTATGAVTSRTVVDHSAELPRINYGQFNTKPNRLAYANGIAQRGESVFLDTIVKFEVESGDVKEWRYDNHFRERVFVAWPEPSTEYDGVLLSVVLDASADISDLLLLLDARDLSEIVAPSCPNTCHSIPRRIIRADSTD